MCVCACCYLLEDIDGLGLRVADVSNVDAIVGTLTQQQEVME